MNELVASSEEVRSLPLPVYPTMVSIAKMLRNVVRSVAVSSALRFPCNRLTYLSLALKGTRMTILSTAYNYSKVWWSFFESLWSFPLFLIGLAIHRCDLCYIVLKLGSVSLVGGDGVPLSILKDS